MTEETKTLFLTAIDEAAKEGELIFGFIVAPLDGTIATFSNQDKQPQEDILYNAQSAITALSSHVKSKEQRTYHA